MFTPIRHRFTALAIIVVAAWAGSIPFWGPLFDLGFGDAAAYEWNTQNWTLYVAPAAAAVLGGLFMMLPRFARVAKFGAWLALGGGLWLLFGPLVSEFFLADGVTLSTDATLASLLYHLIPGFLLTALAGYGIGISTWARRWHVHREDTISGAREHVRRETERETATRDREPVGATASSAAGDGSPTERGTESRHRAIDHQEDREREYA